MRKILYSPGYGAGWTTWTGNKIAKQIMLTYQPIIDFLEAGGRFMDDATSNEPSHALLDQLADECEKACGERPYMGGASDLQVMTVEGRVRIEEYDGSESVVLEGDDEWM